MNVAELVTKAAATHGARIAFRTVDGARTTWAEVAQRVAAATEALVARGVRPGDRVALVLPNSVDFAVAFWGVLRAGAIVVPANPTYTAHELRHILTDSGAALAISTHPFAATVRAAADLPVLNVSELGEATDGHPGAASGTEPTAPTEVAVICYTSGTTGTPKGAMLTHANFLANLDSFAELPALRLTADDVLLGLLPFFHIFGLNVILNAAAREGCSVLVMDHFSPISSLRQVAEHGVTVAYGAPPVFAAWVAVPDESVPPLPALRAAVSGADALPVSTWNRFKARFGIEILESYGLTETAPGVASNAAAPHAEAGTVGMPIPGVEVRVVDPGGQDLPPGKTGEIVVRGPNVFRGYHGRAASTSEVLDADGWFRTGDLGEWDEQGYLVIRGRLKDLVIVSGFNVYPAEVEAVLRSFPGVADAAVVGLPDSRTGERVRAVVVPAPRAHVSIDALLDHCRERLARYKLPREMIVVPALPRSATGKIDRATLRTLEAAAHAAG